MRFLLVSLFFDVYLICFNKKAEDELDEEKIQQKYSLWHRSLDFVYGMDHCGADN
jgi:hypothetical protein